MIIAEDLLTRVIHLRAYDQKEIKARAHTGDREAQEIQRRMQELEKAVSDFANRQFWGLDAKNRARALEEILLADPDLRNAIADAIKWKVPADDSFELALFAVDAALGRIGGLDPAIFEDQLDWENWKSTLDLTTLKGLFEKNENEAMRTKFARAVGAFPGTRHLDQIASSVVDDSRREPQTAEVIAAFLKKHILNWDSFREGSQDHLLRYAMSQDYEFRERLRGAVGGTDGNDLARSAIDLWRSTPLNCAFQRTRKELLEGLKATGGSKQELYLALLNSAMQEPNEQGWVDLGQQLTEQFVRDPLLASALWKSMGWPRPFALVLREELIEIEARRNLSRLPGEDEESRRATTAMDAADLAVQKELFGIAFSGGGIRSATFNLGVLQKLSDFGLLRKVDYLSTVSGGGYIGGWLAGWMAKNRGLALQDFLARLKDLLSPTVPDPRATAQRPIRFLREFSNYLTPRLGSFSVDTWTMVAVYSRNLFLNQLILIATLGALLLIPRLLLYPLAIDMKHDWGMWLCAALALVTAVIFMSKNMMNAVADAPGLRTDSTAEPPPGNERKYTPQFIRRWIVGIMLLAVYLGSVWFWRHICKLDHYKGWVTFIGGVSAGILSFLLSYLGGFVTKYKARQTGASTWGFALAGITLLSAGTTVGLLQGYLLIMRHLVSLPSGVWQAAIWGPVLLLAVLMIPGTIQVGLMGVDYPDPGREWLSRFRALCSIYSIAWIGFLSAAIYGPFIVLKLSSLSVHAFQAWISTLTLGWVITTISGLSAGSSKRTGLDKEGNQVFSWVQLLAKVGPPVFIVGLIVWIATLEQLLLAHGKGGGPATLSGLVQGYWTFLQPWPFFSWTGWIIDKTGFLLLALAIAGSILAFRVDINEFSMHHFYKNRLVRCYLGASNENRRPNPFTGFDSRDDFFLSELRATKEKPYLGPYPILNATLNLSAGQQLAWQERKGASYIFTPRYCGFDAEGWSNATGSRPGEGATQVAKCTVEDFLRPFGYRETETYTQAFGPLMGTAMGISGAAANPNQGYNTSPSVSFLMTMFNVRLGWWVGNPRRDRSSKLSSPRFGLLALLSELVGSTDDETPFVNLSDGGHFDNMGLYELVRRRCRYIILCDAEQDQDYKFEGLGSAIRKCRIDFGALIEIDPVRIVPKKQTKFSESHCTIGKILYLDGSVGTLLYIKASVTGDEPEDVIQYRAAKPPFPHETTADQWFTESQFESYRALGYHVTHHTLNPITRWRKWNLLRPSVSDLFEALRNVWYPVNPNLADTGSRHTATLSGLLERIRKNPKLHALGAELFPGGGSVKAGTARSPVEEFYFSMCVIQLVEDLYHDLHLDQKKWFKDPRIGGWRNLFRTWKGVPAVGAAWAVQRDTFREDFQQFWAAL